MRLIVQRIIWTSNLRSLRTPRAAMPQARTAEMKHDILTQSGRLRGRASLTNFRGIMALNTVPKRLHHNILLCG